MPSRGYRKGISDTKQPRPHVLKSRASVATYQALHAECEARSLTLSALIAALLEAHAKRTRVELPHPKGLTAEAIRELARIGNNLNQVAHQAHLVRLPLLARQAAECLEAVNSAVRRLGA